mgnify:CR=1 FL=1|tara:strand:+ start:264 stop:992 length:729 start_codon:yes stop_codon:yes gene_type:complete
MKKDKVLQFISRYNLNGNVESVKWNTNGDNVCETTFITDDKSVLGKVSVKEFEFTEGDVGVYDTAKFKQLLSVVGDDINIEVKEKNEKNVSIKVSDSTGTDLNFMLADLAVIPNVPALKPLPEYDLQIPFSNDFAKKFVRSASALSDSDTFTVVSDTDGVKLVLGYSTINSNRVSLSAVTEGTATLSDPISFSAKYFKEILNANSDSEKSVLNISSKGIASIEFEVGDFRSSYYLVEIQTTD